jgi:hypothetical protein
MGLCSIIGDGVFISLGLGEQIPGDIKSVQPEVS